MTIFIRPIQEHEDDAVYQMFQDIPEEENRATNHAHGMTRKEFSEFCKKNVLNAKKEALPKDKVPQIMYIIFDDAIPVGFGKFRPFLNEFCIKTRAGHFAYMISPKYRKRGYATAFLSFIKTEAQKAGLTEIEGTPLQKNIASRRVMEKNGGVVKEYNEDEVTYVIKL
ncbi:MAG: GNAT family N-acetyltransferase [Alphaproteobacteria bacterium]|nr:GNAT family N-acetyltransferase [Alphaproteobacteria bacterium]